MAEVCLICSEELTMKNIVNPECGHSTCKDCFWKWTKQKNSCPFCRKSLLCDNDELKDIQHMRGLLEHRTRIVRQVEEAYQENDELHRKKQGLKRGIIHLNKTLNTKKQQGDAIARSIRELRATRNQISRSLGGTYNTFQHFKQRVEARALINRKERERIDYASQNLAHGDKGMCMEVLKDIKCLRKKDCNWRHDKHKLVRVLHMNETRKERKKFRKERLREGSNFDLESLFGEEPTVESPWDSIPEQDQIMENIFRDYFFRDNNRIEPIPLEEDIINDFSPEEERFILDRILLRQASNIYRRHHRPNRMR
tara:strand:+ start:930 stop:1862 length:933 start_codon:yes stop_codon:yes gene_type:complete